MKDIGKNRKIRRRRGLVLSVFLLLVFAAAFIFAAVKFPFAKTTKLYLPDGETRRVELNSENALLIEADTGKVFLKKRNSKKIYPASLTKIMTALLTIENIDDLDRLITVGNGDFEIIYSQDASTAGFCDGEQATCRDLLYGMLLPSGAECCLACAREISGSEEEFARLMNKRAAELGMKNTYFINCTGLHDKHHYSTVEDISILLDFALKNETFREIFTSHCHTSSATEQHPDGLYMQSTLFSNLESEFVEDGEILGGKTGSTSKAGKCLASLARIDGREYILVTAAAFSESGDPHISDALLVYNTLGACEL